MPKVNLGRVKGSMWYCGVGITGTSTSDTVFEDSGVTMALADDYYLNSETGNVYRCTLGGEADTATWVYAGCIKGAQADVIDALDSYNRTMALSANMGRVLNQKLEDAELLPYVVLPDSTDTSYTAAIKIQNETTTITLTDEEGNTGTYTYTKYGSGVSATVNITIGTSIGLPQSGAVIRKIESSDAQIEQVKLYDSESTEIYSEDPKLWDHVIAAEENVGIGATISETHEAETVTYRTSPISKVLNGIRSALFPITHAKAVWYNKLANTTVYDKISGLDTNKQAKITDNATLGDGYGTCSTAAATAAKVVTLSNYVLLKNGVISVKFTYAVPANATLNVNSKGAKNIKYKGSNIVADIIKAGDTATFMYDGSSYHLISVDKCREEINQLTASLTENLDDISLRYNTTSSRPEWKERGADTWNPFSSGFPKYTDELCNSNNLVVGSAHYDENTTKTFYEFLAPENTYLYFIVGRIGAAGDSSTITATNADVIAFRANTGIYANRAKHCILKTTTTSKIHVEGVSGSFILMNAIDDSIITTPTDKGENTTFSVTNGKYYVVSGYVGNNEPTLTGCNKLSSYITVTASSTEVWCAILKATSNTITADTTIQMIEL